jgi:hypothetical protein
MGGQIALDFGRLNANSPDFNLIIFPSQEFYTTIPSTPA